MKKTKTQLRKFLLDEFEVREKKAKLSPDKFSCETWSKGTEGSLLTDGYLYKFKGEIKKTIVDAYDIDENGFLLVKVNPHGTRRDLLLYLIDIAIDEEYDRYEGLPKEVRDHYISIKKSTPELKFKEFLNRYYPPTIFPGPPPFLHPNPKLKKGVKEGDKKNLRELKPETFHQYLRWWQLHKGLADVPGISFRAIAYLDRLKEFKDKDAQEVIGIIKNNSDFRFPELFDGVNKSLESKVAKGIREIDRIFSERLSKLSPGRKKDTKKTSPTLRKRVGIWETEERPTGGGRRTPQRKTIDQSEDESD